MSASGAFKPGRVSMPSLRSRSASSSRVHKSRLARRQTGPGSEIAAQNASASSPSSLSRCSSSQSGNDQRSAIRGGTASWVPPPTPPSSSSRADNSAGGSEDPACHASLRRQRATPKIASTIAVRSSGDSPRLARSVRSISRSAAAPSSTRAMAGSARSARSAHQGTARRRGMTMRLISPPPPRSRSEQRPAACLLHDKSGAQACARQVPSPSCVAMDDPRQLLEEGRFEELAHDDHPLWRGLALLELKHWEQAATTFESAPDFTHSGTLLELAGAARWLAGEREKGVEHWILALDAGYEGPASRLKPPALLIYAGTRMNDERYVLRGTRLLTKSWKPK